MLRAIKRRLYFLFARYFRFWARIKLKKWSPKVIVVTGSAGKTTLLHMIESQLGSEAHYSHHANSAYGISYDILGLPGITKSRLQWLELFFKAPAAAFRPPYRKKIYVAEVDADRPNEAKFLAKLLRPAVTLWVSTLHTHTAQFDDVVQRGKYPSQEAAVAHEYGNLLEKTTDLVIINGDSELMVKQAHRASSKVAQVWLNQLKSYEPSAKFTKFTIDDEEYHIPALLPKMNFYQVAMVGQLLKYLGKQPDRSFATFKLPPGRSSVLKGIKGITIIDSTYNNSNFDSLKGVVEMFEEYKAAQKWLVIGDLLEQGKNEEREHIKIAKLLNATNLDHIILMGKRINKYTRPKLSDKLKQRTKIVSLDNPNQVLSYMENELKGGEAILFKGVGYMEVAIEKLLLHKEDTQNLVRRESIWQKKLAKLGL